MSHSFISHTSNSFKIFINGTPECHFIVNLNLDDENKIELTRRGTGTVAPRVVDPSRRRRSVVVQVVVIRVVVVVAVISIIVISSAVVSIVIVWHKPSELVISCSQGWWFVGRVSARGRRRGVIVPVFIIGECGRTSVRLNRK